MGDKLKKAGRKLKHIAKAMIPDLTPQNTRNTNKQTNRNSSFTAVSNSPTSTSTSNTPQATLPGTPVISPKHRIRVVTAEKPDTKADKRTHKLTRTDDVAINAAGGMHLQQWLQGNLDGPDEQPVNEEPGAARVSEAGTVVVRKG